jgi:hypothetical protein
MKKHFLIFGAGLLLLSACNSVKAPEAILPIPEAKQVEWQKMETYAFVHFGLNTFNDREWGYGDSDPKTFNPPRLDCEQYLLFRLCTECCGYSTLSVAWATGRIHRDVSLSGSLLSCRI